MTTTGTTTPAATRDPLVERGARRVHEEYVAGQRALGVTTRPSPGGVEQLAPWEELPEDLRDIDRATAAAVLREVGEEWAVRAATRRLWRVVEASTRGGDAARYSPDEDGWTW